MQGVISAGSRPTAEAGAAILAAGGHAVDAAVAASFAVAAGEPTVTSLAGGGMMLVRDGATQEVTVLDFFGNAPQLKQSEVENLDFYSIDLNYGPTTQSFYVGAGSAGVPGNIPGLCTAQERWGRFSLAEVIEPACRLLREGAVLGPRQAALAQFLAPILISQPEPKAIFAPTGRFLESGDSFRLPVLADTLEALADQRWQDFYDGPMRSQMLAQFGPDNGGLLTAEDFDNYQVIERPPLTVKSGDALVYTMPPPAAGGPMIGLMRLLLTEHRAEDFSRERALCAAMATADAARLVGRLATSGADLDWCVHDFRTRIQGSLASPALPGGPPSTTHISVVDQDGNAASVTLSHGESNACLIDGMGIMMNNFLGEDDLLPHGFGTAPTGERLATMMSPTIVEAADGGLHVLGTGGSNRIRTAILQVIGSLIDDGLTPSAAVNEPRLHYEAGVLNAETFGSANVRALKEISSERFVPFEDPHLFFGGVNLASRLRDGRFDGGGDPRRGGHCVIV